MNEIERIISEGFWDRSFLEPETICDFYVDETRKKIWLISLDLLREFDRVCRKHGLRYFIYGGTLLGAVRHHGFIPWDDDIDVAMLRPDYDRLLNYADEFTNPYFLQSPRTDKGYFYSFNKLRNVNTSNIREPFLYESFCQGLELDIFPFDFCNCSDGQQKFDKIKSLILDLSTYMRMSNPNLGEADKKRVAGYSGRNPLETFEEIERLCTSDAEETSSLAGLISGDFYGFKRQSYPKGLFYDLVDMVFYGLKVPAPKNYDAVLKTEYGDYMKFPKIEDRGTWHTGGIIDACTSYTNYIKPHLSVRKTI